MRTKCKEITLNCIGILQWASLTLEGITGGRMKINLLINQMINKAHEHY